MALLDFWVQSKYISSIPSNYFASFCALKTKKLRFFFAILRLIPTFAQRILFILNLTRYNKQDYAWHIQIPENRESQPPRSQQAKATRSTSQPERISRKQNGSSDVTNPTGPASGTERVLRGGDWTHASSFHEVTFRTSSYPNSRNFIYGFRLCLK